MPTPSRFSATATANGSAAAALASWSAAISGVELLLGAGELGCGGRERVEAAVERIELGRGGCRDARAAPRASATAKRRRSSAIRSSRASTSSCARRVGLERGDEPVQVAADLAQAHGQLAQLGRRAFELGREPRQRLERPLGRRRERCRAVAVLGRDGRRRPSRALGEVGCVAHAVALDAKRLLLARARSPSVRSTRSRSASMRGCGRTCIAGDLLVVPCARRSAPARLRAPGCRRSSCSAPTNASSTSSW